MIALGDLGQGANGFGRKSQFHATDPFGLHVHLESPAGVTLGVADFVTGLGSASGKLTGSGHKIS